MASGITCDAGSLMGAEKEGRKERQRMRARAKEKINT
jgi:hypothetical protein